MDPYTLVAAVVGVLIYRLGPRGGVGGAVVVALIWPVLISIGVYFTIKNRLLQRPFRSDWVLTLELLACICVTAAFFLGLAK